MLVWESGLILKPQKEHLAHRHSTHRTQSTSLPRSFNIQLSIKKMQHSVNTGKSGCKSEKKHEKVNDKSGWKSMISIFISFHQCFTKNMIDDGMSTCDRAIYKLYKYDINVSCTLSNSSVFIVIYIIHLRKWKWKLWHIFDCISHENEISIKC